MQTPVTNIYALGNYAEIQGRRVSFLSPVLLDTLRTNQHLLGKTNGLNLPAISFKTQTLKLPPPLVGDVVNLDAKWPIDGEPDGRIIKGGNQQRRLVAAFVDGENYLQRACKLIWKLPALHPSTEYLIAILLGATLYAEVNLL